jgi:co-chaperonin GroES (HSP10)
MVNIKTFEPSWKKYEKDIRSEDNKKAFEAGVKFDIIRQDEMRKDRKARKWEESRKQAFLSEKRNFVKQITQQEQQEKQNLITKYLQGGFLMSNLRPSPGFVLTKPITRKEERKTESGLYLAETVDTHEPNQSEVVAVGKDKLHVGGLIEEAPCKVGDTVLHKFGTLELTLKGVKHNLMGFGDVLGVLED